MEILQMHVLNPKQLCGRSRSRLPSQQGRACVLAEIRCALSQATEVRGPICCLVACFLLSDTLTWLAGNDLAMLPELRHGGDRAHPGRCCMQSSAWLQLLVSITCIRTVLHEQAASVPAL